MEQITIEELYQKLKDRIADASNLEEFYIGRTDDVNQRGKEHYEKDNLPITIPLAKGEKDVISNAEKYIQRIIKNNKKCSNERIGGGSIGDTLYISYRNAVPQYNTIEDLYDEAFEWNTIYILIK